MAHEKVLKLMKSAAEKSGEIIRSNFRQTNGYSEKASHKDIVTKTDIESQENIQRILTKGMLELGFTKDEIGFIEEESDSDDVKKYNFIVDPIDGTTNFSSGIPISCVLIGFSVGKKVVVGVLFEAFSETMYWAEVGEGAFVKSSLYGERKVISTQKPINEWVVAAHLNAHDVAETQFEIYQKIYPKIRGMRNIGCLALDLCFLADGVMDAVFCNGCYFWDLAAVSVILREAGAEIYDLEEKPAEFNWGNTKHRYGIVATRPENKALVFNFVE